MVYKLPYHLKRVSRLKMPPENDLDIISLGQTTISSKGLTSLKRRPYRFNLHPITDNSSLYDAEHSLVIDSVTRESILPMWFTQMFFCNGCTSDLASNDKIRQDKCKVVDEFGNIYIGQINSDGVRHGIGSMIYASTEDKYDGHWFCDRPHGIGKLRRGNGHGEFVGVWKHGVLQSIKEGIASVIDAFGNRYDGEFKDFRKHGVGILSKIDEEKYIGNWVADSKHGFGTIIYQNGSRYVGIFNHDKITKDGELINASKTSDISIYHENTQNIDAMILGEYELSDIPTQPQTLASEEVKSVTSLSSRKRRYNRYRSPSLHSTPSQYVEVNKQVTPISASVSRTGTNSTSFLKDRTERKATKAEKMCENNSSKSKKKGTPKTTLYSKKNKKQRKERKKRLGFF